MNKCSADKLREIIQQKKSEGSLVVNRALIDYPNDKSLTEKKKACSVFVNYCKDEEHVRVLSGKFGIDEDLLWLVINYHVEELPADFLKRLLKAISADSLEAKRFKWMFQ